MRLDNRIHQSPDHTVVPNNPSRHLTRCEVRVLQLVSADATHQRIAEELAISIPRVEDHLDHLMAKLGIYDASGLARYAMDAGHIERRARLTFV
jgi:DNA-binding NarL/FixJ family response regulator